MSEPAISLVEAQDRVGQKVHPRVTKESIEAKIAAVDYLSHGALTICIITMLNAFKQIGKAAPADTRNYDPEVGKRYAYEDAFRGLWHLEGYLLCERGAEATKRA
jgi:Phage protein (N4 Gp49/phage Sf6 gene 66) family